jgi:hypothetical protein
LIGVSLGFFPRILNLYFADDTLLFLETTKNNIEVRQWILIGSE